MENEKNKILRAERKVIIKNKYGLHARPAAVFVQTANKYDSIIRIIKDGQEVDAKSIMSILSLGAEKGSVIYIIAEGEDAQLAVEDLAKSLEKDE